MRSVIQIVKEHAAAEGDRVCFWCLSARHGDSSRTWREVADCAGFAAARLARIGVARGDRVVLIGTHNADFYAAWLGAVWLGAIPTVLAEPGVRIHKEVYASRLAALVDRIEAKAIALDPRVKLPEGAAGAAATVTYDALAAAHGDPPQPVDAAAEDTLLLQHSSGTTGLQKGVQLTHGAVLSHAESYQRVAKLCADTVVASWLPLYHDMGLIACFIGPLLAGASVAWLSPFEWVASPQSLVDAVAGHGATHAWLPNFAFHFLAQRCRKPAALSTLRHVVNCSEVVTADAMDAFVERFARDGFRANAIVTCYAMAENVFAVTSSTDDEPPRRLTIARDAFRDRHEAIEPSPGEASITHVSSGAPVDGVAIRIADDDGAILGARRAGSVLIRSPFLFTGYFRRDDLNRSIFDADGFFDTGDLGYVDERGHLYVTGRKKDIIIAAGKNIYPQDVEAVADKTPGIHPGRTVAFGVRVKDMGTDGVVLLAESDLDPGEWPEVSRRLRAAVTSSLDLDLADVKVVGRQELRKSTSGKLARSGNREWYLEARFGSLPPLIANLGES